MRYSTLYVINKRRDICNVDTYVSEPLARHCLSVSIEEGLTFNQSSMASYKHEAGQR